MPHVQDTVDAPPQEMDPELLELPGPPQARRLITLVLMALVVVGSMAVVVGLRHDLAYFFATESTRNLGDAASIDAATLQSNTHVRVQGTAMVSRAVRYRRVLSGSTYVVFPLAGQRTIYVQADDDAAAMARSEFSGRMVTFSQLGGRIDSVEGYLKDEMSLPVSGESFLIIADASPGSSAWALFLAALCLLFVVIDVALFLRWFRPVSPADVPAEAAEA